MSFIPARYRKSRGTSQYTTITLPKNYSLTNYIYIYMSTKSKVGDRRRRRAEGCFSIATTPTCWGVLLLSLDWSALPLIRTFIAECSARRYQKPFFESLVWLDLGLNPGLPDHWRTLYPLDQWAGQIYIYIYIYHHHLVGYPWPSRATSPNRSSPLAGLQGYIPYPHRAAVCMFELVVLLLLGHMRGSIGVHHLWAHPCFSSSVLHVWFL